MERGNVSALILTDLSAAFNIVDHKMLLSVLEKKFGIRDVALKWFREYLQPRFFKVCVNNAYSDDREIRFSVPQGSINGPILFNPYSSTMRSEIEKDIIVNAFADDHSLQKEFRPEPIIEMQTIRQVEGNLEKVQNWMSYNRLKVNSEKMKFIRFGSRHQLQKCIKNNLMVCGKEVKISDLVRYPGVWFDSMLTFKDYITIKCKSVMWNLK